RGRDVRSHQVVHARGVAWRGGVADRASGSDDSRVGRRLAPGSAARPGQALSRDRDHRRPDRGSPRRTGLSLLTTSCATRLPIQPRRVWPASPRRQPMPRLRAVIAASSTVMAASPLALALTAASANASTGPWTARAGAAAPPAVGANNDYLQSDSCTSIAFCMAVGAFTPGRRTRALSEMLSGGKWVARPVPIPARAPNVFANEVSCGSPPTPLLAL